MSLRAFGVLADGRPVRAARLGWEGGLQAEVLEFGGVVTRLVAPAPGGPVNVVLGHDTLQAYEADTAYLGCIVGRCANRIGGARFGIDGQAFEVTRNEGTACLHGGAPGFNKRLWRFEEPDAEHGRRVALNYVSPDGEEGFPGTVHARAVYAMPAPDTLIISYQARADRPTPVNLSQHLYFNLSGSPSRTILDHSLGIAGEAITPVRPDLIPTGALMPVAGTPFDLRAPRVLGEALHQSHPQLALAKGGYDHNWALDRAGAPALQLSSPESGLTLHIDTDQPGMQVYAGQGLSAPFVPYGAIVFEPQGFPDAVNQPDFPDVVLRPGQTYRHTSRYRFVPG